MANDESIALRCGALVTELAPGLGGSVRRFDCVEGDRRIPVLRGADDSAHGILVMASFPLVPFCNRVRGGRFTFRGREVALTPNLPGDPSPMHGQGWLAAWEVESASDTEALLVYRHAPGEWPWAYEARQRFRLDEEGLEIDLDCRNLSSEPMPCGLGLHPYFPCTAGTRLDTGVADVWTIDEQVLPVAKVQAEGHYDLHDRLICGQDLDHGFGGWNGMVRIGDPSLPFAVTLSSPDAAYFQLYSPPEGGIFAAEPVSHANAALNEPEERWPELGLRVLGPGQTMAIGARIAVLHAGVDD